MRKHKLLAWASAALLLAVISFGVFVRSHYIVPILMYHSVNPAAQAHNRLAVTDGAFRRQMRFLKEHRYNVIPLEALVELIRAKKKIPARAVAITFDDGYKDVYSYAFPVLREYQFPATVFLIVNEISRPQADRLSWQELEVMQESGLVSFGSHCLGPEPLVNLKSDEEIKKEIFESKRILQERLGQRIVLFSYPEGKFDAKIKKLVKDAGYQAAVATKPGKKYSADDLFALKRLRISQTSNSLLIFWVEASGYYLFFKER
jgi:peptidoglycan/xylan/chitin deacetylase (PgdA/CDA1 family)